MCIVPGLYSIGGGDLIIFMIITLENYHKMIIIIVRLE